VNRGNGCCSGLTWKKDGEAGAISGKGGPFHAGRTSIQAIETLRQGRTGGLDDRGETAYDALKKYARD